MYARLILYTLPPAVVIIVCMWPHLLKKKEKEKKRVLYKRLLFCQQVRTCFHLFLPRPFAHRARRNPPVSLRPSNNESGFVPYTALFNKWSPPRGPRWRHNTRTIIIHRFDKQWEPLGGGKSIRTRLRECNAIIHSAISNTRFNVEISRTPFYF